VTAVRRWLPVAAWAALIFVFSTGWFTGAHTARLIVPILARLMPGVPEPALLAIHDGVRKLAHFGEYAVLSALLARALSPDGSWTPRTALGALGLAVVWAALDELHQLFVPGRGAAVGDVVIDAAGALAAQVVAASRRAATRAGATARRRSA
jgi:VanZ family protein